MAQDPRSRRDAIRAEAALWVVRLSDPESPADADDRARFEAWRAEDPAHEIAYERERAAWEAMDRLRALNPGAGEPDADLLAAIDLSDDVARPLLQTPDWARKSMRRFAPPRWATIAATLVLAVAVASSWTLFSDPAYATGIGERRVVVLEDGTRVELNTDSKIVVHYRGGVREVRLLKGEALFDIRKDSRPFLVVTPDTSLKTVASVLNVRLRPDGAGVVVKDGAVAVRPVASAAALTPINLTAGQEGVYGAAGSSAHAVSSDEVDRELAGRQGANDLLGQTLKAAVEEFNRYNTRHMVVADDSIADLRLGGYFRTDDVDGFVRALRTTFPVKAISGTGRIDLSWAGRGACAVPRAGVVKSGVANFSQTKWRSVAAASSDLSRVSQGAARRRGRA